jgi:hypothetical protein
VGSEVGPEGGATDEEGPRKLAVADRTVYQMFERKGIAAAAKNRFTGSS